MRVSAVVAAHREEGGIGRTVWALLQIPAVAEVVVVDDGSPDGTAREAAAAGADVLRLPRRQGKAAAVAAAVARARGDILLLADADLGASARCGEALVDSVARGWADMAIAVLPPTGSRGGLGLTVGLARWAVRRLAGLDLQAPLSGQRALRRQVWRCLRGGARGFGLEVALDVDAARAGYRLRELPSRLLHRVTQLDAAGFAHRGRQLVDVAWTVGQRLRAARPR